MDIILRKVKILGIKSLTHDTKSFIIEKPENYFFVSGQSMFTAIDDDSWRDKPREFTISSKPNDNYLELIIKIYNEREGVTKAMDKLKIGDYLLVSRPFGNLDYKPEKYNNHLFIAAGSGITKFLSLLRSLKDDRGNEIKNVVLIYSNKTKEDIILEDEIKSIFSSCPKNLVLLITRQEVKGYVNSRVNKELLSAYVKGDSKVIAIGPGDFSSEIMGVVREIKDKS
ncbi:MAG: FAD-binding oxidoreductase [Nanoarchaeota archaeon]